MAERNDKPQARTPQAAACPICGKPATARYRPFCSRRCADVDLNRWLSGRYAIAAEEQEGDEDGAPPEGAGGER